LLKDLRFWLIIAATALLMLVNLGKRDFWDPDEARYAQVAREMMDRGQWFFMHINGVPYPDKPPMSFWATAVVSKITGQVDEFSARFFPAISGIFVIALSMLMAGRMFGKRTAFLTAIILATSYTIIGESRWVHMDMPLTAVMAVMFFIMYRGAFETKNPRLWIYFFILAAVGILIKGPVGLMVPLFAGFTYLLFLSVPKVPKAKRWALALIVCAFAGTILGGAGMLLFLIPAIVILALTGGFRPIATRWFVIGFVVLFAILLPWLIPMLMQAEREQPGLAYEILVRQNIGRFAEVFSHKELAAGSPALLKRVAHDIAHQGPFFYYYFAFPMIFVPWVFLLPSACAPLFRKNALAADEGKKRLFLFALALGVILFFSFSSSKRELYVIPALLPAAMLIARYFEDLINRANYLKSLKAPRIAVRAFAAVVAVLAALFTLVIVFPSILYSAAGLFTKQADNIAPYVNSCRQYAGLLVTMCAVLAVVAIVALYAVRKSLWGWSFGCLAMLSLIISGATEFLIYPNIIDQYKSAKPFTEESFAAIGNGKFAWYGEVREGVLCYSGRDAIPEIGVSTDENEAAGELTEWLETDKDEKFILTTRNRWDHFLEARPEYREDKRLREQIARDVGAKELLLIAFKPAP